MALFTYPVSVPMAITNITTVGNGTWTAAGIASGVINRSGPVGAYTDITDTAANIIAARPDAQIGLSWEMTVINTVAFACTMQAGAGVTISGAGTVDLLASAVGRFLVTITGISTPAVSIYDLGEMTA